MTAVFIVLACLLVVGFGIYLIEPPMPAITAKARQEKHELETYSWPANQLLKLFREVPTANRPYGEENFATVLKALDVRHGGKDTVNQHFMEYSSNSWQCCWAMRYKDYEGYEESVCSMSEYHDLKDELEGIQIALAEQAHALELAGVQNGLNMLEDLTSRLREERQIIEDTTKELV